MDGRLFLAVLFVSVIGVHSQTGCAKDCDFHQALNNDSTTSENFDNDLGSVTWHLYSGLQAGLDGARQGVLKVTPKARAKAVSITFGLLNPRAWSFHIGNTRINNGYGGGSLSFDKGWNAEIHNINRMLYFWERASRPPVAMHLFKNYFSGCAQCFNLTMSRAAGKIDVNVKPDMGQADMTITNDQYFDFKEFYIGLNRIVAGNYRSGSGTHEVCIKFH